MRMDVKDGNVTHISPWMKSNPCVDVLLCFCSAWYCWTSTGPTSLYIVLSCVSAANSCVICIPDAHTCLVSGRFKADGGAYLLDELVQLRELRFKLLASIDGKREVIPQFQKLG